MKAIVGLGNPGEKYTNTRHNVGFMVLDEISSRLDFGNWENSKKFDSLFIETPLVILVKPQTFMNQSGEAVSKIIRFYKIKSSDLILVHDDLDIVLGEYKIQSQKGPKVHNGIASIEEKLGTYDFIRARVGVDNRELQNRIPGETYVLDNFREDEKQIINTVINSVSDEIIKLLK